MKRTVQTAAGIAAGCGASSPLPFEIRADIFERGGIFVREGSDQLESIQGQHEHEGRMPRLELDSASIKQLLPGARIPRGTVTSQGWSPTAPSYQRETGQQTLNIVAGVAESLWEEAEKWNAEAPASTGTSNSPGPQSDDLADSGSGLFLDPLPAVEAAPMSPGSMRQLMLVCHADFIDLLVRFLTGGESAAKAHVDTAADGEEVVPDAPGVTSDSETINGVTFGCDRPPVRPPARSHFLSYNCAWTTVDLFPGRAVRVVHANRTQHLVRRADVVRLLLQQGRLPLPVCEGMEDGARRDLLDASEQDPDAWLLSGCAEGLE